MTGCICVTLDGQIEAVAFYPKQSFALTGANRGQKTPCSLPTVREAIDAAMSAAGLTPEPRETVMMAELHQVFRDNSGDWSKIIRAIWAESKRKELVD